MRERQKWLDIYRALAVIMVVLNHSVEEIFISTLYGSQAITVTDAVFMYVCFTLGRIGVPLFLIISGALLLRRQYRREDSVQFYKNNFIRIVAATWIWIVLYHIFDYVFYQTEFSVKNMIMEFLLLKNNRMPHMWYMPMIIGVYLAIPFIANAVDAIPKWILGGVIGIVMVYTMLLPTFIQFINVLGINKQCSYVVDLNFLGGCYGVYLIFGYLVAEMKGFRRNSFVLCCLLLSSISLILTVMMQVASVNTGNIYRVWYDSVLLFICAAGIVGAGGHISIKSQWMNTVIEYIAKRSLAVYFVHMPFRFMLIRWIPFRMLDGKIATILFTICILISSLLVIKIVERIPFVKKWVLVIK